MQGVCEVVHYKHFIISIFARYCCCSCEKSILNFKIHRDASDGKYFVTPKKKFSTVKELLETHRKVPLKSKARAGAKIFLLHPITRTDIQMALDVIKQKQESQSIPSPLPTSPAPLPPPWKEYFDKNHQRPYYYNPDTRETAWDRPKGDSPKQKRNQKSHTIDNRSSRPLPNVPEESLSKPRLSLDPGVVTRQGTSPRPSRRGHEQRALPDLPSKSPSVSSRRETVPQLPPKDVNTSPAHLHRGSVPNLPPKQLEQRPSLPTPNLPPLPSKNTSSLPPLPEKLPSLPKKDPASPLSVPELPPKDFSSSGQNGYNPSASSLPPLPRKDSSSLSSTNPTISLPPLPPKEPSFPNTGSNPPAASTPPRSRREYEETIILTPNTKRSLNAPLPPPITMNSDIPPPPPPIGGPPTPPPAPPIPAEGKKYVYINICLWTL